MGVPRMDDLHATAADFLQAFEVGVQKFRPLVRDDSTRARDGEGIQVEGLIGPFVHVLQERLLRLLMRLPEIVIRKLAACPLQHGRIRAPAGCIAIEETLHGRTRPCGVVNAVGDGINRFPREHAPRDLSVDTRDRARVAAQVHGEVCHGERILSGKFLDMPRDRVAEDA